MEARKLICYTASDPRWDELYELWGATDGLTAFVEAIRKTYPDIVAEEPAREEVSDITDEDDQYILCYDDGMDDCVTIYGRLSVYEEIPF